MCFLSKSKFQIMTEGQFLLVIKTSVPLQAIDWDGLTGWVIMLEHPTFLRFDYFCALICKR